MEPSTIVELVLTRFLQPDLYRGALSDLSIGSDPLTQNRYSLAGGNPLSLY
jgi:hypothetical protein